MTVLPPTIVFTATWGRADIARIAVLLPDFGGGGAERVGLSLIEGFLKRGHEVDLLVVKKRGALLPLLPAGVRVVELGGKRLRHALRPLIRYLRRERPDALQASMWPLTILAIVAWLLVRTRTRVVVSDHAILSRQYEERKVVLGLLRRTVRLLYPKAHARVAVSKGAADDLARLSGLPRECISVITNPISLPRATSSPLGDEVWPEGCARIISVGALKREKNHEVLISALAILNKKVRCSLVLLGEGALRSQLEKQIQHEQLVDQVMMPGYVADPFPYLRSADLFVLSSDHEGFGNVIVEALYAGLPIVSTDCPGGPREILADGLYGRLVPCGDTEALACAMEEALAVPVNQRRQSGRARALAGATPIDRYLQLLVGHREEEHLSSGQGSEGLSANAPPTDIAVDLSSSLEQARDCGQA